MYVEQVETLIWILRTFGSEDAGIEAKRAGSKLPDSLAESLCAFANTPEGGFVLLGVDENANFAVTGVTDAAKVQADLATTVV
ncbi:helix-turn-helix domain-containing protein [Actinoplanes sp. NPDC051494]|uniref:helix-turn-helix domain-containing protein n=1 Tax=Actinoplanes sp. NPDC051494 TaxID=3363907 RepID=UPI0037AC14DD